MRFLHRRWACVARAMKRLLVLGAVPAVAAAAAHAAGGQAGPRGPDPVLEARDALRRGDRARLDVLRAAALDARHPLAPWVDYWSLLQRLPGATPAEVRDFRTRWPGTYVAERLHHEWLAELGRRRDWASLSREAAGLRVAEDGDLACYALLLRHQAGEDVAAPARALWLARRGTDDGCLLLAGTLLRQGRFTEADVWMKLRSAMESLRPQAARPAAALLGPVAAAAWDGLVAQPSRHLAREAARPAGTRSRQDTELAALALVRLAGVDPAAVAAQIDAYWAARLPPATLSWTWAAVARQAALGQHPQAHDWYRRAAAVPGAGRAVLSDDLLAWEARAVLRAEGAPGRWAQLLQAVEAMGPQERQEPAWVYWQARALQATALPGAPGAAQRARAAGLLESLSGRLHFYGKLAAAELGRPQALPPRPPPLGAAELARARSHPGLTRGLALIGLGLRDEGVREWNFSLRGMDDRALRAAAQRACAAEVWDRCINTSDRTREEIDLEQRFPTPFRADVEAAAREAGLDPAYVYAVIRQESRFVADARSAAGAAGLMQLMPATASATARSIGLAGWRPEQVTHAGINLRIGAHYLKQVLDDFGGSQALAAAAYNAGPSRPRRWRCDSAPDLAAWTEGIPFSETRDYVKKVLSNAAYYAAVLRGEKPSLRGPLALPAGTAAPAGPQATALEAGSCAGLPPGACPAGLGLGMNLSR
jgi:soluble lytic murein transglycosylase